MAQIIYNVTTKVRQEVSDEWLLWMKEEHVSKIMATGCFSKAVILKLREVDDSDDPTYAVQYHAPNEQDYKRYLEDFATNFRSDALTKWRDKIVSFRTVLEVVN